MLTLSLKAEQRFLSVICVVIGTIMAYRGIIDFFLYKDNPWRALLGLIFFGGVVSIFLIHRRYKGGFWLFVFFDFSVGLIFIFALQDVWYHHVWPHIAYAAVFVPFYSNLYWRAPLDPTVARLVPAEPEPTLTDELIERAVALVDRFPLIARCIEKIAPLQRWVNRRIINSVTAAPPHRPLPYSLWTPGAKMVERNSNKTYGTFVSWPGLVDRAFTGRHLPPASEASVHDLPELAKVTALFHRDPWQPSDKTTALFCFFAQWFTDSFLRTNPDDRRKNTSNHEIDLCQIYGLGQESTRMLREARGGRLKARLGKPLQAGGQPPVYPEFLADPKTLKVKHEFAGISFDPIAATSFDEVDPPHGLASGLRELLASIGEWTQTDERWRYHYAAGLERANSTIVYSAINTIFLREHNRLAGALERLHPDWNNDQLFEAARNINIAQLLKVIIEDYINHLAGSPFKLRLEQGFADRCQWYRTNRISLEFNLLYRWHPMVPDVFQFGETAIVDQDFRFNNAFVERHGVEAILDAASRQRAGKLCLYNSPSFLAKAEEGSIAFARQFRLAPYNAYRRLWKLRSYRSISDLTGGDQKLTKELEDLYPALNGVPGIERIELPVGLLAEKRAKGQPLPQLLQRMVASDAFSQALTNPLLAAYVYGADCFTDFGVEQLERVTSFADIVARNLTAGTEPLVTFTTLD